MFTGIIQDVGIISDVIHRADPIFVIATQLDITDLVLGASIACNGVCLTVIAQTAPQFQVQVSAETLAKTTAKAWGSGMPLNLERPLRAGDELGGHFVSGHVDAVLPILSRVPEGESLRYSFGLTPALQRFIAPKGSITLDGISLTVNEVTADTFGVNIIPHTQRHTNAGGKEGEGNRLGAWQVGGMVNAEIDLFARYVDRILSQREAR
jgi:riboflavin synthase